MVVSNDAAADYVGCPQCDAGRMLCAECMEPIGDDQTLCEDCLLAPQPKVITLCGSTKFKRAFQEFAAKFSLGGNIVLSVSVYGHADGTDIPDLDKRTLDRVYKRKIDLSDEVFVLDVGGYIGDSTHSEIEYARLHGKLVRFLSQELPEWKEEDAIYSKA